MATPPAADGTVRINGNLHGDGFNGTNLHCFSFLLPGIADLDILSLCLIAPFFGATTAVLAGSNIPGLGLYSNRIFTSGIVTHITTMGAGHCYNASIAHVLSIFCIH
ncbi:MAG: hypothetical protein R2932_14250 [Caldilineaceae bacterium]